MPNFDEKTGIRYGVISPHSVGQWAMERIYDHGTDPHYEYSKNEILRDLRAFCDDHNISFDRIDPDPFMDEYLENYESPDGQMDYSDNDYDLHVSGDNFGIFVLRSPYYTYCRDCSPCAPGAGDLNNPLDPNEHEIMEGYHRALCLGPEWFDKPGDEYARVIQYRVFRVDNDQEVI